MEEQQWEINVIILQNNRKNFIAQSFQKLLLDNWVAEIRIKNWTEQALFLGYSILEVPVTKTNLLECYYS